MAFEKARLRLAEKAVKELSQELYHGYLCQIIGVQGARAPYSNFEELVTFMAPILRAFPLKRALKHVLRGKEGKVLRTPLGLIQRPLWSLEYSNRENELAYLLTIWTINKLLWQLTDSFYIKLHLAVEDENYIELFKPGERESAEVDALREEIMDLIQLSRVKDYNNYELLNGVYQRLARVRISELEQPIDKFPVLPELRESNQNGSYSIHSLGGSNNVVN